MNSRKIDLFLAVNLTQLVDQRLDADGVRQRGQQKVDEVGGLVELEKSLLKKENGGKRM
jgi:hypothetical protein